MIERADHGGDVHGIARSHSRSVTEFADFSANINPLGPPPAVRALLHAYARSDAIATYPEPGLPELAAELARTRGVEPRHILIHAGSSALFDVIFRACAPRRVGICAPAFAEYARAAAANDIAVSAFALDIESAAPFDVERFCAWAGRAAIDAAVLTNPHNPLGFALRAGLIRELRRRLPATTLIVDEAFADYDESVSVARDAAHDPQLIVVRSVTKFFAIPDLRVGYAVMTEERARTMARYIPAWPVCGIAAAAAAAAVCDEDYVARTLTSNVAERAMLARGLAGLGFRVLPPAANFITFEAARVAALRERLLTEHGVIIRDCSGFGGLPPDRYVRVAVRSRTDNLRLLKALGAVGRT